MGYHLVYADNQGTIRIHPDLAALGRNGHEFWEPKPEELIPLPPSADLFNLPDCFPVGMDEATGEAVVLTEDNDRPVMAVAAFLPMGYARLLLPAWERAAELPLPLYGYTAVVGDEDGRLFVAALPLEVSLKWDPFQYPQKLIENMVPLRKTEFPGNRIVEQLAYCSLNYHCLTAQNLFFRRWEAGIPVSRFCNARCLGCISEQPADCCPSPQRRVDFLPELREIVEPAVAHLNEAEDGIVSFGQGCEGEPLTVGALLADAVRGIRRETGKGTININTNGGFSSGMDALIQAGLDAARVSLFSAVEKDYNLYHRPQGYSLADVRQSLRLCKEGGVATSLNLLVFPGFTDRPEQWAKLRELLAEGWVDRIQFRNLNIDPDLFLETFDAGGDPIGLTEWLAEVRREFPEIAIGSFSLPQK